MVRKKVTRMTGSSDIGAQDRAGPGRRQTQRRGPRRLLAAAAATAAAIGGGAVLVAAAPVGAATVGTFTSTGALATARADTQATVLTNGKVLVAAGLSGSGATAAPTASAESYDPTAETWSSAGSLTTARYDATTTLLPNGQVLVAGGLTGATAPFGATNTAELYNPSSNTWSAAAAMTTARFGASATLLSNGSVLVAGGDTGNSTTATATNTAELYNPSTNSWSAAGSLTTARAFASSTALSNGNFLVAGGEDGAGNAIATAEQYNPSTNSWTSAGSLATARHDATATLLPNGQVLVAGGENGTTVLTSAELYNPSNNTWSTTGSMATARFGATVGLLPDGTVLIAGGEDGSSNPIATAERFNPSTGSFSATGSLGTARAFAASAVLSDGYLLVAGGESGSGSTTTTGSAELYYAGLPPAITSSTSVSFTVGQSSSFTVTTSGSPAPSITETGVLPAGLAFHDNGNGTATISGTPQSGTVGSFPIRIFATNGVGAVASQSFVTLVVIPPVSGYWIASSAGTVYPYGQALSYSNLSVNDKVARSWRWPPRSTARATGSCPPRATSTTTAMPPSTARRRTCASRRRSAPSPSRPTARATGW